MTNWWPFNKKSTPKEDPETAYRTADLALRHEIDEKLASGVSRQAILHYMEAQSQALEQEPETITNKARLRAFDVMYSRLKNDLVTNLSEGKNYEMVGRVEEAIQCYETAVADQVATRFPYEHLRIIYRQRGQPEEALRVCQTAVHNPFLHPKDLEHFRAWAEKLEVLVVNSEQ